MQAFQALLVKVKHHVLEIQVCMRTKFLLEREDKPEKWGEGGKVDVEMGEGGGQPTKVKSKVPFITFWIFSLSG